MANTSDAETRKTTATARRSLTPTPADGAPSAPPGRAPRPDTDAPGSRMELLRSRFGLRPEDLNIDLGPLGKLL